MSIWQDTNGGLHDDMGGTALTLPNWPQGMTLLTTAQVAALQAQALAAIKPTPNTAQFIQDSKSAVGGISALATNASLAGMALFLYDAITTQNWPDATTLLVGAQSSSLLSPTAYSAIKASAIANNIPITLP